MERKADTVERRRLGAYDREALALFPLPGGADQAIGHEAEPEIHHRSQIDMEAMVLSYGRQRGHEDEIDDVAQNDRRECLQEVNQHCWFRHRESPSRPHGLSKDMIWLLLPCETIVDFLIVDC